MSQKLSRRGFVTRTAALGLFTGVADIFLKNLSAGGKAMGASKDVANRLPATIVEAGRQLRNGSLTSEALTKAYLARIKRLEPQLNAFITVTESQALKTAATLDAELKAGKDRGPLHGIPIVYKDIYDTAASKTTVGSEYFQNRIPQQDATVVQHLKTAGVVSLGKTNLNEFAAGLSGQNKFYGDTPNVWNESRSPGGSSSGTATAIAAGLCLGGTGTDTGGSIRVPASWSSLVGIRPTYGLVSRAGIFPRSYSLDVAGPLAHTVTDVALLLDAMASYDPRDSRSSLRQIRGSYTDDLDKGVKGLRLGVVKNYTFRDVDPEVVKAVQAAIDTFAKLGAEIVTVDIPLLGGALEYSALFNILLYEFNQILGEQYRAAKNKDDFGPIVQSNLEKGAKISGETYKKALQDQPFQIAQVKESFKKVDALLTPTMPMVAPLLTAGSDIYDRGRQFTLPFSFTALPSVSVPCGYSSESLPIGLQIVGNHFEEALILRIAAAFESDTKFHERHPAVFVS